MLLRAWSRLSIGTRGVHRASSTISRASSSSTKDNVEYHSTPANSSLLLAAGGISRMRHTGGGKTLENTTLGATLAAAVERAPGSLAVHSLHEGRSLTYGQLLEEADALGAALLQRGLEPGDRLAVWAHNCLAWPLILVACARAGLVPVAINPAYEPTELSFCLRKTGARGLLLGARLPDRNYYESLLRLAPELPAAKPGDLQAKDLPDLRIVVSAEREPPPGTWSLQQLVAAGACDAAFLRTDVKPDDGCIIHFTSGTTGSPKAALDSHIGVVNQTRLVGGRLGLTETGESRVCVQTPIFHALGSVITVLAGLRAGAGLLLPAPAYSARRTVEALLEHGTTVLTGTPTMHVDVVSWMQRNQKRPPALRTVLTAGAPCSPQLFRDIKEHLSAKHVKSLYGMTETTASVFMSLDGESEEQATETVGFLQDHVEVQVVDSNGAVVPMGAPGELQVRGYNIMLGYWGEPELTRCAISEDGWLSTGDSFTLDPEGYGRIVGRLKDIIVRGGENIAPKELEDLLDTHPDVLESQVVGVPEQRLGEEIAAVVRLRPGATLNEAALRSHLEGQVAKYKLPKVWKMVEEFPKTASGKIQKYRLRQMIEKGEL